MVGISNIIYFWGNLQPKGVGMSERLNYYLTIGIAGGIGSALTAVGNAFGFSRRIKSVEDSMKCFDKRKTDYRTIKEQDINCKASIALINLESSHHANAINSLKKEQKEGFDGVHQRLDTLICGNGE